jgi:hypothetical protein
MLTYTDLWFFIYSVVDRHLGFYSRAVMNIHKQVAVWTNIYISFGYIHEIGIRGHMVTLCLNFWQLKKCLSKQVYQFIYPSPMGVFQFLHILVKFLPVFLTIGNLKLHLIMVLNWLSLMILSTFSCTYCLIYPLKENVHSNCSFLMELFSLFSSGKTSFNIRIQVIF